MAKISFAEFKRMAASGDMFLELVEWFGKTDFRENLKGVRHVTRTNSVELTLTNKKGEESSLRYGVASLFECDGESVIFYAPGVRELTVKEQSVLNELNDYLDKQNPYSNLYWAKKKFFQSKPEYLYLSGDKVKGKRYNSFLNCVEDNAIKGKPMLKYRMYLSRENEN